MTPEEPSRDPIPAEIIEHRAQSNFRLGCAFVWSRLVAEMAAERTVPAPNPWTPTDPEGEAA